ncbi:MAG: hypothetical protein NKF70_07030 [Methanobacterium sp. ERen5]|nr:MAG: hypothetical protein NKF70_07030 [Methanobacterium sp. ERen5]
MAEKTELRQKVIGIGFEDDLIVKSQRGRTYSVKLAEDLEIDTEALFSKDTEEEVWATIDTGANPWVVLDVEITG